jgi:hypothetical protein
VTTRRTLSARGRRMYGLGVTSSWKRANYAYPRGAGPDKGKRPSYPIDPRHVRAALSRASQRNTASSRGAIESRLRKRYGSVANALKAARRASPPQARRATSTRRGSASPASRSRAGATRHRTGSAARHHTGGATRHRRRG